MKYSKICLLLVNPLAISLLLLMPLSQRSWSNNNFESIIPESDLTGGDKFKGRKDFGGRPKPKESVIPESDTTRGITIKDDGSVTFSPEISARLDGIAQDIFNRLNSGKFFVVPPRIENIEVPSPVGNSPVGNFKIDIQQRIAGFLGQYSKAIPVDTTIENVSLTHNPAPVSVTPLELTQQKVFGRLGKGISSVSDRKYNVSISPIGGRHSHNYLKGTKVTSPRKELQTFRIKVFDESSKEVTTHTLRGNKEQVDSAASAITALTLAEASPKTIDVAKKIALDSGIKPKLLVNMMLNCEGLFEGITANQASSLDSPPKLASNNLSGLLLAQKEKSIVDATKFASSIEAYNQVIQESEPEVYRGLMKNSEFQLLGETLQKLRKSL